MDGWLGCSKTKWWVLCFAFLFQSYIILPATFKTTRLNGFRQYVYVWMYLVPCTMYVSASLSVPCVRHYKWCELQRSQLPLMLVGNVTFHLLSFTTQHHLTPTVDLFILFVFFSMMKDMWGNNLDLRERERSCGQTKTSLRFYEWKPTVSEEVATSLCRRGENPCKIRTHKL